jgi:hypothetical protein
MNGNLRKIQYGKNMEKVNNSVHCEFFIAGNFHMWGHFKRKSNVCPKHVAKFWCSFILTSFSGIILNLGCH